jgi:hypothetical protein
MMTQHCVARPPAAITMGLGRVCICVYIISWMYRRGFFPPFPPLVGVKKKPVRISHFLNFSLGAKNV